MKERRKINAEGAESKSDMIGVKQDLSIHVVK
jgi:hypothetical protein